MKSEHKNGLQWVIFALIIVVIVVLFILSCGSFPLKQSSPTEKYDKIDFGKIPYDIEKAIKDKEAELKDIHLEKESIMRGINRLILFLKCAVVFSWVIGNIAIGYTLYGSEYGISNFLEWNQGLLIITLFCLFMISERYSNIHTAFAELKEYIKARAMNDAGIYAQREQKLKEEIYFLEAIYYCHPGLLAKETEKPLVLGQEVSLN